MRSMLMESHTGMTLVRLRSSRNINWAGTIAIRAMVGTSNPPEGVGGSCTRNAATSAVWVPLEFVLWRARGGSGRLLWWALALSAVGAAFSAADVTRLFCDPQDHFFQGHAIWHVLTAASFYALFRHHQQLPPAGSRLGKTFPTGEG